MNFVQVILSQQLQQHLSYLEPVNRLFRESVVDPDQDGVIDHSGLRALVQIVCAHAYMNPPPNALVMTTSDRLIQ